MTVAELAAHYERHMGQLRWSFAAFCAVVALGGLILVGLLVRRIRQQAGSHVEAALRAMPVALCMIDAQQRLVVCNVRFLGLFGLSARDAQPGRPMQEITRTAVNAGRFGPELITAALRVPTDASPVRHSGQDIAGQALSAAWERARGRRWVATFEDVTERQQAEARIRFMAHHDPLTALPNRLRLGAELDRALESHRGQGTSVALLCLDLDGFKDVNDTFGHPAGDVLLKTVAARLQSCVRERDLVVRLGGDEFAVLQAGAKQPEASRALAARIVDELAHAHDVDGHLVFVGCSVGVAVAGGGPVQAAGLLQEADTALYCAKADGRGAFRVFEPAMDAMMRVRRQTEGELRQALDRGEIEVFYQPLFDVVRNRVSGFEALLRWRHPVRGLLIPAAFVPIAEELGLMAAIGRWALLRACTEAAAWPGELRLAVNVSPGQLRGPALPGTIQQVLDLSGFPAHRLDVEITESALLKDSGAVLEHLHAISDLGARITFDKFGTGYSSLAYLQSFPFHRLKMDVSFIEEIGFQPDCAALVRAIGEVAQSLGMIMTAAGVETTEQLNRLRAIGCAEVQGNLFDPPRPANEIGHWFKAKATAPALPGLDLVGQEDRP